MVICSCHKVTDKDVRRAVLAGARSLACLEERLRVSSCCGRCAPTAAAVLEKVLADPAAGSLAA